MKENKISEIRCKEIDDLIAKKFAEMLSEEEDKKLSGHLRDCENCQRAFSSAEALFASLHSSRETSLLPRPAIRRDLRKKVKQLAARQPSLRNTPFDIIISVLKVRVPVYQAVLGMVVFLMVMLYANYLSFPGAPTAAGAAENYQLADSTEILDSLKIQNIDRIGRNLKEDSLLARFFKTVM